MHVEWFVEIWSLGTPTYFIPPFCSQSFAIQAWVKFPDEIVFLFTPGYCTVCVHFVEWYYGEIDTVIRAFGYVLTDI